MIRSISLAMIAAVLSACAPNDKPPKSHVVATETASAPASAASAPEVVNLPSAESAETRIRAALKATAPKLDIDRIRPVGTSGLYEIRVKGYGIAYVSADGKYMVQGELLRLEPEGFVNETEAGMSVERKEALAAVPLKDMIVFPAKGERKGIVYVFTDIDCGYCRKMHSEMAGYNQAGVEVRYLAFPRAGYPSPSSAKLEAVWCSPYPQEAMTRSKQGQAVSSPACQSPVKHQFELGSQLGVRGTPAVFTENGEQVGGYVPAAELAGMLGIK